MSNDKIAEAQAHLQRYDFDGWLLYDFQGSNTLARAFLNISSDLLITRRYAYWIPARGEPIKLVHKIEPHVLDHLPGQILTYLTWEEFESCFAQLLKGSQRVALEFSPRGSLPYVSKVDGGILDLIRSCHVEVVSSASFLQYFTCVLDDEQVASHLEAAHFLSQLADSAWEKIAGSLRSNQRIDEYSVVKFMREEMRSHGFITEADPICAVNAHSANPHFAPTPQQSEAIKKGDFVLIDLWCKKNAPRAVYGDITRVAFVDDRAPQRHQEIFQIVRNAQRVATNYVIQRCAKRDYPQGGEVDQVCRQVIIDAGYGEQFIHRTGHNIYTQDHGPGAHLDSLETRDFRELIPRTCFSIEPGIYLKGEFGVRLEYDVLLVDDHTAQVTGGIQEEIVLL